MKRRHLFRYSVAETKLRKVRMGWSRWTKSEPQKTLIGWALCLPVSILTTTRHATQPSKRHGDSKVEKQLLLRLRRFFYHNLGNWDVWAIIIKKDNIQSNRHWVSMAEGIKSLRGFFLPPSLATDKFLINRHNARRNRTNGFRRWKHPSPKAKQDLR